VKATTVLGLIVIALAFVWWALDNIRFNIWLG